MKRHTAYRQVLAVAAAIAAIGAATTLLTLSAPGSAAVERVAAAQITPTPAASPSVPAIEAPEEDLPNADDDDDAFGPGRGAVIVGVVAIGVAVAVMLTVGRQRRTR